MLTFYGTFGNNQFHPMTGQNLTFSYVELDAASQDEAEAIMWERFGGGFYAVRTEKPVPLPADPKVAEAWAQAKWSFMSSPSGGPITRTTVPESGPRPLGATVTMRVVLSKELARENALFLAGRCIAHRPGPHCRTEPGAGVWFEDDTYPTAWHAARTFAIEGEGVVLLARYVGGDRAREEAEKDPAHVSIVSESESLGYLGFEPDSHMGPREIFGDFAIVELNALSSCGDGYRLVANAADRLVDEDDGIALARARVTPKPRARGETATEARERFFEVTRLPDATIEWHEARGSGFFTTKMFDAICAAAPSWGRVRAEAAAAIARVETIKTWRDTILGVDVRDGQIAGVRMTSR
jgi:hypothetical protein